MDDEPAAYDLGPLMRALLRRKDKDARVAGEALKAFKDALSCSHDLQFVHQSLAYLDEILNDDDKLAAIPPAVFGSVLNHSILLYARATQPGKSRAGEGRTHLKIRSKLTPAEQALHDKLDDLRNKSIAHLDQSRPFGDKTFADENIVLVYRANDDQLLLLADRRVALQRDMQTEFLALVQKALDLSNDEVVRCRAAVEKYLPDLVAKDPTMQHQAFGHPFDAVAFFGDPTEAERFLTAGEPGEGLWGTMSLFEDWPDAPASNKA